MTGDEEQPHFAQSTPGSQLRASVESPHPASSASGSPNGPRTALFRAVGLNEAADIQRFGGFRQHPGGRSMEDKWFATSHEDAVEFGRLIQRELPGPLPFVVVEVEVPKLFLASLHHHPRLDRVGPVYLVRKDQLAELNRLGRVSIHSAVYSGPPSAPGKERQ